LSGFFFALISFLHHGSAQKDNPQRSGTTGVVRYARVTLGYLDETRPIFSAHEGN